MGRRWSSALVAAFVLLAVTACGGGEGSLSWRDLTLELPDGWSVFEEADTRLGLSNVPLDQFAESDRPPTGDVIAVSLMHGSGANPGGWRDDAAERGVVVERDEAIEVGGVPATRFVLFDDTSDSPRRELVVVVPSRQVVLLATPVTPVGSTEGPEVYDRAAGTLDALVASIRWGAPVDAPGG